MAKSALITQALETGTAGSIGSVSNPLNALNNQDNAEIASLTNAYEAHVSKGLEAHGVTVTSGKYTSSKGAVDGLLVAKFPTTTNILYTPASLSPAGINS